MYGQPPYDGHDPFGPYDPYEPSTRPPRQAEPGAPGPDVGIAPPGRRAAAWGIDFGITVAAFLLLLTVTYHRIADGVPELAVHGAWDVASSRDNAVGAAKDAWNEVVSYFHEALVIFVVLQFAHQFTGLAWTGRTAGQAIAKIKVQPLSTVQAGLRPTLGQAARRAAVTTATESGLYAVSFVLLLAGAWAMAVLCWLLGILAIVLNGLPATRGPWHRSLGDRVADTVVVETSGYRPSGHRPSGHRPPPARPDRMPPDDPWAD
jgi:hypothetical protein